jgi:hypothetical protein
MEKNAWPTIGIFSIEKMGVLPPNLKYRIFELKPSR